MFHFMPTINTIFKNPLEMLRINYINITDALTSCRITLLFSPNIVVLWHKRIK